AHALAAHALSTPERAVVQLARSDQELSAARWLDAEDATVHQGVAWALDHDLPNALKLALALAPWWLVRRRCGRRCGGGYAPAGCRGMPCCSAPPGRRTRPTVPGAPLRSGWVGSPAE